MKGHGKQRSALGLSMQGNWTLLCPNLPTFPLPYLYAASWGSQPMGYSLQVSACSSYDLCHPG